MDSRDDFSQKTKDILCERVGGKCSNPNCRRETKGPHTDSMKRVSIGQAAHITAAAEGGPRYNANFTVEQRKSIDNGIWLCNSCAKMIDNDEKQYPIELLYVWKSVAEYEQLCIINQTDSFLSINGKIENRKNVACRKIKEALENLHNVLQYAYQYWKYNFENRFYDNYLENELIQHWELYKDNLEEIYLFQEKRKILHNELVEYSLDLGLQLCEEIEHYSSLLNFSYKSDNWGGYDNYWRCFFEMISAKYNILNNSKKAIDNLLYQQYSK